MDGADWLQTFVDIHRRDAVRILDFPHAEARLKGSGMRWERTNVNPMLALRNGVCNERWQETWHTACQQRRMVRVQHRQERATQRQ